MSLSKAEIPSSVWCWGAAAVAHVWAARQAWLRLPPSGSGWAERGRTEPTGDTAPSLRPSLWSGPETGNTGSSNLDDTKQKEKYVIHGKKKLLIKAEPPQVLNIEQLMLWNLALFHMLVTARRVVLRNLLYLLSPSSNSLSLVQCVREPNLWYAADRSRSVCYRRPGWGTGVWPGWTGLTSQSLEETNLRG